MSNGQPSAVPVRDQEMQELSKLLQSLLERYNAVILPVVTIIGNQIQTGLKLAGKEQLSDGSNPENQPDRQNAGDDVRDGSDNIDSDAASGPTDRGISVIHDHLAEGS